MQNGQKRFTGAVIRMQTNTNASYTLTGQRMEHIGRHAQKYRHQTNRLKVGQIGGSKYENKMDKEED